MQLHKAVSGCSMHAIALLADGLMGSPIGMWSAVSKLYTKKN